MLVEEFAKKYSFRGRDKKVAMKVYAGQEKTEQEWFNRLEKEYDFQDDEKLKKVREAKAKKAMKADKEEKKK